MGSQILHRKKMRGFTLVEVALVIVVAMLFIGGATVYWNNAQEKLRYQRVVNAVSAIDSAVHSNMPATYLYTGLSMSSIWSALPGDVRGSSAFALSSVPTPWGGSITLAPMAGTTAALTRYGITINTMPTGACVALLSSVSANFQTIWTQGVSRKTATQAALSPTVIGTACAGTGGADPTQIVLVNG